MRGFILAAGLGTRLRPLTDHMPKPLVPIGGEALVVRAIRQFVAAGVGEIAVNLFHKGDQIAAAIGDGGRLGARITWLFESPVILGTGGGVAQARAFLRGGGPSFLLANGDVWHGFDLTALIAQQDAGAVATLALHCAPHRPELHTVFVRGEGRRCEVAHIGGRPHEAPADRALIYTGVGVYSTDILAILPAAGPACLVRDGLIPALAAGRRVAGALPAGAWFDCGTRGEVMRACAHALRERAAAIAARSGAAT